MTKAEFLKTAKPITVVLAGSPVVGKPKYFSTGSVGYYACGKASVQLPDGSVAKLQVGANVTVCGSKEWEDGADLQVVLSGMKEAA